ncbi:MAG: DUF1700 domain-containing protein [Coriobacteriales bacterium]|nr:DUF1700 domain-containing protein [Coriobacteriales bacterium]
MNKQEFLVRLQQGLAGLPQDDVTERMVFYSEMIDDRVEDGLTEEEAVAQVGSVDDIVVQIIQETPITKLVREAVKPKRSLRAWEIVLLVLGSPLWIPLLVAAFAIVLSIYVVIWAVIISLWAVELALALSSLACMAWGFMSVIRGDALQATAAFGAGFVLAGVSILLFYGCLAASKGAVALTKKVALWIKSLFIKKEDGR